MKNPFIIFGGIGVLLIIGAGVWVFLFLFYTPAQQTHTLATNPFVEGDAEGGFETVREVPANEDASTNVASQYALKQITTRKVAGAVAVGGEIYRFVEAGTGHIYEVDAQGVENKLSNTTFAGARKAVWSRSGTRAARVPRELPASGRGATSGSISHDILSLRPLAQFACVRKS